MGDDTLEFDDSVAARGGPQDDDSDAAEHRRQGVSGERDR